MTRLKITGEGVFKVEGEIESEIIQTGDQITRYESIFHMPQPGKSLKILFKNNGLEDFFVINGKKLNFDSHLIPQGESKLIKLRPGGREKYEFGVAPAVNTEGVPVGSREFPATMFDLPCSQGGKMVRIEGNQGGPTTTVTLVKVNNEEIPLKRIGEGPLQFSELENFNLQELINRVKEGESDLHIDLHLQSDTDNISAVFFAVGVDPEEGL